ncbi:hypothetical protein J2Z32_001937 [Paenibacillus turicensis]|uniref:Cold-shock protein n=1 Tax=Paenibacillus turicensis TaxID=160487 RepID=A0ABS4FSC3_9BACL|nr:hypothetical protein [Paenibacillus turicensis]
MLENKCWCGREADYELHTGKEWQPHCKFCMEEAVDCSLGAIIRRIGNYERTGLSGVAQEKKENV